MDAITDREALDVRGKTPFGSERGVECWSCERCRRVLEPGMLARMVDPEVVRTREDSGCR